MRKEYEQARQSLREIETGSASFKSDEGLIRSARSTSSLLSATTDADGLIVFGLMQAVDGAIKSFK